MCARLESPQKFYRKNSIKKSEIYDRPRVFLHLVHALV